MLRFLSIRQLAVIDALEVELSPCLTVLTGETGAGKSILVEAVGLLLGGRASADLVRTGADGAQVQGILEDADGRELLVRREVSASGRSRAFVNGDLVTSAQLKDIVGPLVDLHGQHEHQALLDPRRHLELLDHYAVVEELGGPVAEAFEVYRRTREALEACRLDDRERAARIDLVSFQLEEIDRVRPVRGEDEELSLERQRLANVDRIHRLASEAYLLLYEGDTAVIGQLVGAWKRVADLAALDPALSPYIEARDPIRSQLEDLAAFLRSYLADLEASPERLQQVEDRLALLERVKRRHGPTLSDVLAKRSALSAELEALKTSTERANVLTTELDAARAIFLTSARELGRARRRGGAELSHAMSATLADFALPAAVFEVRFMDEELAESRWSPSGLDSVEFFFSANPGETPRPLARVVSGGELSRVMLALKTLASTDASGKTLIFDEVDAGIGGRVADVVGERLRALGRRFQVLCITHLPQVAAHGHAHLRVSKDVVSGRSHTRLSRLDEKERIEELARMIGGSAVTTAVRAGAREMLEARAKDKEKPKGESERAKKSERAKA